MSYGQDRSEYRISDEEMRIRVENELRNAAKEAERKKYQSFSSSEWNGYHPEDSSRNRKNKISILNNKFILTPLILLSLLICYWTFSPLFIDMSNDTDSIKGWGELKSDTAYFSDVKVVEHLWLIGERGFFTRTYDVQVFTNRNLISVESVSQEYMDVLVDRYWTSGVPSTISVSTSASQNNPNPEIINEYNAYYSQYNIRLDTYNEAVDNWNVKITAYNDFMSQYNSMSSSQRTSPSTQDEMSLKASELRSAGRNLIVESKVFESHIDDMVSFMEVNKDAIMEIDSQKYMQRKSDLVAKKAICQGTEEGINEILNKLD